MAHPASFFTDFSYRAAVASPPAFSIASKENGSGSILLMKLFQLPLKPCLWLLFAIWAVELVRERFQFTPILFDSVQFRSAVIIVCGTWFLIQWKLLWKRSSSPFKKEM